MVEGSADAPRLAAMHLPAELLRAAAEGEVMAFGGGRLAALVGGAVAERARGLEGVVALGLVEARGVARLDDVRDVGGVEVRIAGEGSCAGRGGAVALGGAFLISG